MHYLVMILIEQGLQSAALVCDGDEVRGIGDAKDRWAGH